MPLDYSRIAEHYDAVRGNPSVDREYWLKALVDCGELKPGERILDLGAGTGRFSALLAEFASVVAADVSAEMLAKARGKGRFDLVRADACRLPFQSAAFDATLLVMVVHQLPDYARAIREVARVSHRIVVATSDMEKRRFGIVEEAFPSLMDIDRERFPRIDALADTMQDAGFRRVRVMDRPIRRSWTVDEQLDRVRRKYISTFDLLPEGEFERGLAFLERELPARFGEVYATSDVFTFVAGSREP